MKEIEKQQVAEKIKALVDDLNAEIDKANVLKINVAVKQNPPAYPYPANSYISVSVYETVSY